MKKVFIFLTLTLALTSSGCSIPKSNNSDLTENKKSDNQIVSATILDITTLDDLANNKSLYENKLVTVEGYIYSADIEGNFITGDNQYLNLRDKPDMNTSKNMSMKITADVIRRALIDEYNSSHSDWVKVEVSGTILLVKLAGLPSPGIVLDVYKLIIK